MPKKSEEPREPPLYIDTFEVATGADLVELALKDKDNAAIDPEGRKQLFSLAEIEKILYSRNICVWGECNARIPGRKRWQDLN
jgi:hypothetical protein